MTKKAKSSVATRSRGGMLSSLKSINMKDVLDTGKKGALLLVGIWAGQKVFALIDKHVGGNATVQGLIGVDGKKILTPAATALVGLGAAHFLKKTDFRFLGFGIALNAGMNAAKSFLNVSMLEGVDDGTTIPGIGKVNLPALEAALKEIDKNSGAGGGDDSQSQMSNTADVDVEEVEAQ